MLAAGIVGLIVIVSGAAFFVSANRTATVVPTAPTLAEPARLSIVVLPFTNLSNDPSQDYFADGVTENLTTELSRLHDSFVIARNTAFSFKGKSVDAREIGKELGVRYVLEGSVQRDGTRERVNAQLIDAGSGAHLWADRFEEDVADLFKLQDQVVARLANSLGYELVKSEAEKGARSKSPTPSISPCAVGPWCGRSSSSSGRRRTTMRRKPCSNRHSQSTRTKPMRWRALLTPIFGIHAGMGERRDRLRGKDTRSGQPGHRARPR
jgi:TolB-like protein